MADQTNLQKFTHNILGSITTLEKDGEVYFKAKEVAEVLEYENTKQAILVHVSDKDKFTLEQLIGKGGLLNRPLWHNMQPHTIFVNESGLNDLVLDSRKPQAKIFRRWVTKDVLPSIRKTGSYSHHMHLSDNIATPANIPAALRNIAKAYNELADAWNQEQVPIDITPAKQKATKPHINQTPEQQFLTCWWDCVDTRDVTAKDLYRVITNQQCPKLQAAAVELFGPTENWTSRKLGNVLRNWSQQDFQEFVVLNLGKTKAGTIWRLEHR